MPTLFVVFALLVLLVFVAIALLAVRSARRADDAWTDAAGRLGTTFEPGGLFKQRSMHGVVEGRDVRAFTYTRRSGNNSATYTAVEAMYPSLGLGLKVTRETVLHRVAKVFGYRDAPTGDAELDEAAIVKGDDPARVEAFFTPARAAAVSRLFEAYRSVRVDDNGIRVDFSGVVRDADRLVGAVNRVASAAATLRGDTSRLDRALLSRLAGDLDGAASQLRSAAEDEPSLEAGLLEAETLRTAGRTEEATERFAGLAGRLPGDAGIHGWSAPPRRTASPPPRDLDVRQVAAEVFDADLASFEAIDLFEERYQDATVMWTGDLQRIERITSDRIFATPGRRAVVAVATIEHRLFGMVEVDAIVGIPDALPVDREPHRDERVRFRGRLIRIDPLMRNVYVTAESFEPTA